MMKRVLKFLPLVAILYSCSPGEDTSIVDVNYNKAETQYVKMLQSIPEENCFPRTTGDNGNLHCTKMNSWTEGFFPGSLWYLYEHSGSEQWKQHAIEWTEKLEPLKDLTRHHDIGFMMYCSFGNGYRLTKNPEYRDILIQSARSLITRFDETIGAIKSWNQRESWDGVMWHYPVIIDNMMNLELLYFAYKETGETIFRDIANTHAETTARDHIRDDYSTYHVVNYDEETGDVLHKQTCQGFADNSVWARGQAWGIYGFTMAYRQTENADFLEIAKNMADFFMNHPNLPDDAIPFWDFNVGQPGYEADWDFSPELFTETPRDASAAAITASALLELSRHVDDGEKYLKFAERQLKSLSSSEYRADIGENNNFLLKHSVGSIPHGAEIDVPIVYADYYYLEALKRLNEMSGN